MISAFQDKRSDLVFSNSQENDTLASVSLDWNTLPPKVVWNGELLPVEWLPQDNHSVPRSAIEYAQLAAQNEPHLHAASMPISSIAFPSNKRSVVTIGDRSLFELQFYNPKKSVLKASEDNANELVGKRNKIREKKLPETAQRLQGAAYIMLMVLYLTLCTTTLEPLDCVSPEDGGSRVMEKYRNIKCATSAQLYEAAVTTLTGAKYVNSSFSTMVNLTVADASVQLASPTHFTLVPIAVFFTLLYVVGIPLVIAYLLWTKIGSSPQARYDDATVRSIGRLFLYYQPDAPFWELIGQSRVLTWLVSEIFLLLLRYALTPHTASSFFSLTFDARLTQHSQFF